MIPEHVRGFLRTEIKSTWMLDLLMVLKGSAPRAWAPADLIAELRGSKVVVEDCLARLVSLGIVSRDNGRYHYAGAGNPHAATIEDLVRIYAEQPLAVIKEILSSPNDKIQSFIDAFKLKR